VSKFCCLDVSRHREFHEVRLIFEGGCTALQLYINILYDSGEFPKMQHHHPMTSFTAGDLHAVTASASKCIGAGLVNGVTDMPCTSVLQPLCQPYSVISEIGHNVRQRLPICQNFFSTECTSACLCLSKTLLVTQSTIFGALFGDQSMAAARSPIWLCASSG